MSQYRPFRGRGCITVTVPTKAVVAARDDGAAFRDAFLGDFATRVDWVAGVTMNSERFRPTLNGQPVAGALAASVTDGWIDVAMGFERGQEMMPTTRDHFMRRSCCERLHGVVELVPDQHDGDGCGRRVVPRYVSCRAIIQSCT